MPHLELEHGSKMWYTEKGRGMPIVFVHDWLCCSRSFLRHVDHFGQWYRSIAFDMLGHGQSDKPDEASYTFPEFASNLDYSVKKLIGDQKFVLVGHAMGGSVGLTYATTPEFAGRLRGLVLVNSAPKSNSPALDQFAKKINSGELRLTDRKFIETQLVSLFFNSKYAKEHKEHVKQFVDRVAANKELVAIKTTNSLVQFNVEKELGGITVPTMILAGGKDALIPPDNSRLMNKKIKKSDLRILSPDIGHMAQCEAEEQFKAALTEFLFRTK